MAIERLTPEEREYLASPGSHPERKALRIIAQQAVELARLGEVEADRGELQLALAASERARLALEGEVVRLREMLGGGRE